MSNYRLRAAMTKAGTTPEDVAGVADVDVKTVRRWMAGRTPRPTYRTAVARALHADEQELWPDATPTMISQNPLREIAGAYTHTNDPDAPDWQELIDAARTHIDLLDYTLQQLLSEPSVIDQLSAKAREGVRVRILISNPDSLWATMHDHPGARQPDQGDFDEDEHGEPVGRLEAIQAQERLQPLLTARGVEVRQFIAQRYNSILRFDEHMLLTLHTYGQPTEQAPLLYLRRGQEHGLFGQFSEHFEQVWEHASEPLEPEPDEDYLLTPRTDGHGGAPTPQEAQQALDRLRRSM